MPNVLMTYEDVRLCASDYFCRNYKYQYESKELPTNLMPKCSTAWKYRRGIISIFSAYLESPQDFNCLEYDSEELKLLAKLFEKFDGLFSLPSYDREGLFGIFPKKLTINYLIKARKHLDDFYNQLKAA